MLEVELKQLNRGRTYGLVGLGMAGAIYLAVKALTSDPGREGPPEGDSRRNFGRYFACIGRIAYC